LRKLDRQRGARRTSAVPLTPQATIFAHQFHDPEITAVDSAFVVDPGNWGCHNTPQKPDQPRKWELWG